MTVVRRLTTDTRTLDLFPESLPTKQTILSGTPRPRPGPTQRPAQSVNRGSYPENTQ